MCATPSPASAFPMWCRSSASTRRRGRGGWPAARPIPWPSVSSEHCMSPAACPRGHEWMLQPELPGGRQNARRISRIARAATSSPASGSRRQGGHADFIAYSQIRFPLQRRDRLRPLAGYRGRRTSDQPPDDLAGGNTSYPWRDNFCEARSFNVGQCPGGFGHQGEDIRPAPCPPDCRRRRTL